MGKYVPARDSAARNRWRLANPEKTREAEQRRYAKHREKRLEANKQYRQKNLETIKQRDSEYRDARKNDPIKAVKHQQHMKSYSARYYQQIKANPEKYKRFMVKCEQSKLRRFGLTPEKYREMQIAQDNKCAICRRPETSAVKGVIRRLAVDHCS